MKVIDFEFFTTQHKSDPEYGFWSRVYEYKRVLDKLKEIQPKEVHNVACGLGEVHIQFANKLYELCNFVLNTDNESRKEGDKRPLNYGKYDITEPYNIQKFDCIICVSTLEHLPKDQLDKTLDNLINQTKEGGHILLTFDYPDIDIERLEKRFGVECKKDGELLTGSNSVCKQECYKDLKCVLLDIQK